MGVHSCTTVLHLHKYLRRIFFFRVYKPNYNDKESLQFNMLKNTQHSYGWVTIVLHWLQALGILFMFGLGLYMVELTYYDAWYKGSLDLHKSLGICMIFVVTALLIWRTLNTQPRPEPGPAYEHLAAKVVKVALYLTIIALLTTGYLISTADGRSISVFELFEVPALLEPFDNQETLAGDIHEILAWSLMGMVALHFLAALKHHFMDKDKTLRRMLRPQK